MSIERIENMRYHADMMLILSRGLPDDEHRLRMMKVHSATYLKLLGGINESS